MADAPKKGRLTLYEDLLSAETLAEMKAKDAAAQAEEAKKKSNASLMFKPTNLGKKSTAAKNQPNKPKPTFVPAHKFSANTGANATISAPPTTNPTASSPEPRNQQLSSTPVQATPQQGKAGQKRGFTDWLADEDEEWQYYERPKLERGGKKKKKTKNKQTQEQSWSWDDIYDPTVPVKFLEYPKSDAHYDVNDAWKRRLYGAHRRETQRQGRDAKRRSSDDDRFTRTRSATGRNHPPPGNLNFAPPADYSSDGMSRPQSSGLSSPRRDIDALPSEYAPAELARDETGDDAFSRRVAMSRAPLPQSATATPPPVRTTPESTSLSTAPTVVPKPITAEAAEKATKAAAQIAALKAKIAASKPAPSATPPVTSRPETQSPAPNTTEKSPAPQPIPAREVAPAEVVETPTLSGTISAGPTFNPAYFAPKDEATELDNRATESSDAPDSSDVPRSNRPGQAGFAERMLKKMGWEKGQGLGAAGDGITTAIVAKAEKRKKLPDSAGGGFAAPANMGKIVGGKKKPSKNAEEGSAEGDGGFGKMSEVIKLEDMLKGLDVDLEIQDNNLLQEVGDEMGQFGTVERLFIWREHMGGTNDVFVKFTSQLSALRAVRAMDGEEFAENTIKAKFWDAEKFERNEYV